MIDKSRLEELKEEGYTTEQIELAEERVKALTVEEMLDLDKYISKLEAGLPEAPASVNFYGVSKKGWNMQFTLRDVDEFILIKRLGEFIARLEEMSVEPKPVGIQPAMTNPTSKTQEKQEKPSPVYLPDGVDLSGPDIDAFEVSSISHQVSDKGIHFLVVKGGRWTQYGWKAWPEVMPKSVDIEKLPFGETNDVPDDLRMTWACTTKGKGKIVAFAKKQ